MSNGVLRASEKIIFISLNDKRLMFHIIFLIATLRHNAIETASNGIIKFNL